MTPPIRPAVHAMLSYEKPPETMTLREAAEWFKKVVRGAEPLGMLTALESKQIDEAWSYLCTQLAEKQGVPAGMLSYFLGELANTEIRLVETAKEEFEAAKLLQAQ